MEMDLAIRPAATRVLVFTWGAEPFNSLSWDLAAWLRMFPPENCLAVRRRDLVAARNWAMRELVLKAPARIQDFIFVDRDMRPGPRALPFLAAKGDLVGCLYDTGINACSWSDGRAVHGGLFRFNRAVADALKGQPPWWQFGYSADGCDFQCECRSFQAKVEATGLAIARAGWCGHKDKE